MDGILGFEPRLPRSERGVLPLDDIPTVSTKRQDSYCSLKASDDQGKIKIGKVRDKRQ